MFRQKTLSQIGFYQIVNRKPDSVGLVSAAMGRKFMSDPGCYACVESGWQLSKRTSS
jgi:hypothetical protein